MGATAAKPAAAAARDLREVNLNHSTLEGAGPCRVGAGAATISAEGRDLAAGQIWMKVAQTRPSTGPTHGRRVAPGRSGATGFAGHVQAPQTGPAGVAAPSPLAALGTVLAAQEAQDGPGGRRRALLRGHDLLDELNQIRIGLLEGGSPVASIRRLAGLLQADRSSVADARLNAVLDEIELRAAVELAKRQQGAPEPGQHEPGGRPILDQSCGAPLVRRRCDRP